MRFLRFARRIARVTLVSYSQVLLSGNPRAGLFFVAASFAAQPLVGLSGLIATLSANLVGFLTYPDRIRWELGLAGYNAVMLGLAIGHFLPNPWGALAIAAVAGALSAVVTEAIYGRFRRRALPVLGLPFLIVGWLVLATGRSFLPLTGQPVSEFLRLPLSGFPALFLRDLGSVYYSAGLLSGVLVLIGLLVASRISAALGLAGALLGALVTLGNPGSISFGINVVIVPIGLMFFLAPNRWLPLHLAAGSLLTVGLGLALEPLFRIIGIQMLILPLTLTLFIYLMLGQRKILGVELVPLMLLHNPETNLHLYRRRLKEPLRLPFFGTWFVSQGVNGGETHRGRLGHAWDFMVKDERGRSFVTPGYRLPDYHAFGLLVSAPAAGRIVALENGVMDNPPGRLNREQNWGNWVIIEHSLLEYSILAHLQQNSIRVGLGERVVAGTVIGACGNSGYSGQPHLHYQLQVGAGPGSEALPANFGNYVVLETEGERFVRSGIPAQGETVQPLVVQEEIRSLLIRCFTTAMSFVCGSARLRITVAGGILQSGPTRVMLRSESEGIAIRLVRGPGSTLLGRMFAGLDFIPFYCHPGLTFHCGAWRHSFGHRERLPQAGIGDRGSKSGVRDLGSGIGAPNPDTRNPDPLFRCDALILESVRGRVRRRLWLAAEIGIARVDWADEDGKELESWHAVQA